MARLGTPSNRPRRNLVAGAAAAAVIVGAGVVMHQRQAPETPAETPRSAAGIATLRSLFGDGFEGDGGGGGPVPPVITPPAGFSRVTKTWSLLWAWGYPCGRMQLCERNLRDYPRGQSYPAPLGANKGTYVVVPFTPLPNQSVNLYFDQVQSRPQIGYRERPAAGMYFTISNVPGDFRLGAIAALDRFGKPGCRIFGNSGALFWTTGQTPGACHVVAGESLFLNIIAADPRGGIQPGEHSCEPVPASATGCDVGAVISTGPGL